MNETRTSVESQRFRHSARRLENAASSIENQRFRHSTRRLENAASSKLAELIESLEAIEELNDRILAAIEGETEAVFERVRKRLKGARMYTGSAKLIAQTAAEAAAGMEIETRGEQG